MTQVSAIQVPTEEKTAGPVRRIGLSKARSLLVPSGMAVIGIGAIIAVVWTIVGWSRGVSKADAALRAVIEPRTFTVSLKEKGELRAAKSTDIKCEVEGRSTIISLIPEGTPVKEGDLLVTLASDQIETRIREEELKEANAITAYEAAKAELEIQRDKNASDIRKAMLQIDLKQLELEKYDKGEWAQKLKDAEIAIEQARITLDRREQDFNASKELRAKNYTTETEFKEAEFNFLKAQWDLEKAIQAAEVLKKYTRVAEFRQKESDLQEAIKEAERVKKNADAEEIKKLRAVEGKEKELSLIREQLAKLRRNKEKCRIVAPTQGFVAYYTGGGGRWGMMMSGEGQIKEGAEVFERQILMQLPDTSVMMAVVRVHEAKTDKLRLGQPAVVTVEGIPGRQFSGKVTKIAALADSQGGWLNPDLKEYETEITLDPVDIPLKPGVTAHVEILVHTVESSLAVPVQSIYSKGGKRFVFRDNGGEVQAVEIALGQVGTEWAEVTSGVNSGDRILLAFSDEHRRLVPDLGPMDRLGGPPGMPQEMRGRGRRGGRPQGQVMQKGGASAPEQQSADGKPDSSKGAEEPPAIPGAAAEAGTSTAADAKTSSERPTKTP